MLCDTILSNLDIPRKLVEKHLSATLDLFKDTMPDVLKYNDNAKGSATALRKNLDDLAKESDKLADLAGMWQKDIQRFQGEFRKEILDNVGKDESTLRGNCDVMTEYFDLSKDECKAVLEFANTYVKFSNDLLDVYWPGRKK